MSTLAERFIAAVDQMHALDTPSQVLRRILADPVDTGLRAASLDGKVRGGSPESHPERMADMPARRAGGRHVDDMVELRNASTAIVESVIGLLDLCLHRSPDADGYGWADALKDAHLLAEMGVVEAMLDVDLDRSGARCVERYCRGVVDLAAVARRWPWRTGRPPTSIEATWNQGGADEDMCRICLQIEPVGAFRVPKMPGRNHGLCRVCYELRLAAGVEPPPALLGVWHDCDREGRSVAWRTARSRWLESVGAPVCA